MSGRDGVAKIKSCSVKLRFATDSGYRSKASYSSGKYADPGGCLEAVADEIARIAELHGAGDQVEAAVKDARQRVREYLAAREPQP